MIHVKAKLFRVTIFLKLISREEERRQSNRLKIQHTINRMIGKIIFLCFISYFLIIDYAECNYINVLFLWGACFPHR